MKTLRVLLVCIFCITLSSCLHVDQKNVQHSNDKPQQTEANQSGGAVDDENREQKEDGAVIEDGTYNATVDYNNPSTGYSATYTLDVEVNDGQVIQIDFPNGGYLDEDHITAADIDEEGDANVEGEDGKTYDVHIDP